MAKDLEVRGTLALHPRTSVTDAVAYIRVRDVSLADGDAPVTAEQVIRNVSAKTPEVPFALSFRPAARARYSVEAHLSMSGGREVERGDFLTTQSYPVKTGASPFTVRLIANRIE